MSRPPAVTVLMAAYNDRAYLADAVASVLGQTFGDFEFLVVDDGSTDGSWDDLRALRDPRVRLLRNAENVGLTRSLNLGLDRAAGRYVARMDADDVALPERLARQVAFLDRHPAVGVVGSARIVTDEAGREVRRAPAVVDDLGIRWKCLLGNPFAHPTVMLRRAVLERHGLRYDPTFRTAQDYELWTRLLPHARGANLDEPLLRYRMRNGISRSCRPEQLANHDRIAAAAIRRLVPSFALTSRDVTELRGRFGGHSVREPDMDPGEPSWVGRYCGLLDAFVAAHAGELGIDAFHARQREFIGHAVAA